MNYKHFIVLLFFISCNWAIQAQENQIIITRAFDNLSWENFVEKVETKFPVKFYFKADEFPKLHIQVTGDSMSLSRVLNYNLNPLNYNTSFDNKGNCFVTKAYQIDTELADGFFDAIFTKSVEPQDQSTSKPQESSKYLKTRNEYITHKVTIGSKKEGTRKKTFTLSGKVRHASDGSPIVGGTIYVQELETGTTTDDDGIYKISLEKGNYTLVYNSIDSKEMRYEVTGYSDGFLNVTLDPDLVELEEVEIRSELDDNVQGIQMGYIKLDAKDIKEVPTVLGERDIIKIALLMPGIQSVGEGAAGFNVRGSPADQNLFYIGSIPVYNSSHFFGFFSAFNPDVVDEFTIYKSNIPAIYGGRLSSIFDISNKQGNMKKFSARGGISPITARLMVEGPIVKDKLSYLAGFRMTYSDWVLRLIDDPDVRNSNASFGDGMLNLTYNINKNNRVNVLGYFSRDNATLANLTKFNYENQGLSVSWLRTVNHKLDLNLSLDYSRYGFRERNEELAIAAYDQSYTIDHTELSLSFNYRPNKVHQISIGLSSILYNIDNGTFKPLNDESLVTPLDLGSEKGIESGIYLSDEWKVLPYFTLYGGLRYNIYNYLGEQTVYKYADGKPREEENITDTLYFGNNQIVKTYGGLDYRFAATYLINPDISVKASYNRLHQYIFMLSNTIAMAPTDKWKLADYNIVPMKGDQVSVGFYSNFGKRRMIELSVETYYKWVQNLVEYKEGANLIVNEYPERDVLQGKLNSYGIEFMIRKSFGKLNGWLNYTYSRSIVQVIDDRTGENNNFGLSYPANYDKPHSLNVVANYKFSKRLSVSGNIVYSTGRPITYPTAVYYQDGQKILHYSTINEYRIPDYFRIDASITLEGNLKKKKFLHGSWIFSVYNLTGRKNAYSVYFTVEDGVLQGNKLSIFGTQIFSITYDFKLGNYNE